MNGFRHATSTVPAFLIVAVTSCSDAPTPQPQTGPARDTVSTVGPASSIDSMGPVLPDALPSIHVWTHDVLDSASQGEPAMLTSIRTAQQEGFDRIVFEFAGPNVPGFHVSYIDKPVRQCASGAVVPLQGEAWLQVRLFPANGHTEAGRPAIADRNRVLQTKILRQLAQTCDFEADVTWTAGVLSPNDYRVMRLTGPSRLVVDVRHE